MKALSRLFIFFGILWCLMGGYYFWLQISPNRLSFKDYKPSSVKTVSQKSEAEKNLPQRIIINDLAIDLPVIPARIENDTWETTKDGVSFLNSSPLPGNKGNSVLYGHNWASLLGNLLYAKPGQKIEIIYTNGSRKTFIVEYISTVSPAESSILDSSNDKRITIYTCTGFLDAKRFVVVALLDETPSFAAVARP